MATTARIRASDGLLAPEVAKTVQALTGAAVDAAAIRLAEQYADAIDTAMDRPRALAELGPKLLAVLESLGATPRARSATTKGGASDGPSRLDILRATRRS